MFISNILLTQTRHRVTATLALVGIMLTTVDAQLAIATTQPTKPSNVIFSSRVSEDTLQRGASFSTGKGITIGFPGDAATTQHPARLVVRQLSKKKTPASTDTQLSKAYRFNLRHAQVTGSVWLKIKTTETVSNGSAVIKYWDNATGMWKAIDSVVADDHTVQGTIVGKNNVMLAVFSQTPPVETTDTPAPVSYTGAASWYANPYNGSAMTLLPRGSVVRVKNLDNGKEVTVRINDYGPAIPGRVIDLDDDSFAAIAPLSSGVIHRVQVTQVQ